ncbi:MAG TPA: hypothetical protein VKE25_10785, partial [Actinomycetes bacterium]|nr:hypothetical protein [Actinomycetes bacterium]
TSDGKVTLKMTTPTTLGRDGHYHDVTMELINPTPHGYRAATVDVAFTDLLPRYARLKAVGPTGVTAIPFSVGCDTYMWGTVAERVTLPAGTAQTFQLRLAIAMSTPDDLQATWMTGALHIADSTFKRTQPSVRFELTLVDSAPASADQPVTQTSKAEAFKGAPIGDPKASLAPTPAASAPAAQVATPPAAQVPAPETDDNSMQSGPIAIAALILLVSSLGALAMLRRTSHR